MGAMHDRIALPVIGLLSAVVVGVVAFLTLGVTPGPAGLGRASALPAVNAALNGSAAVLLVLGFTFIRRRRVAAHRACMLAAFVVSTAFLVSYVVYHALAGSRPFGGTGWLRWVYYPVLVSHIVLSAVLLPFVLTTLWRAVRGQFDRHARLARVTLPVWLYASVTGVLVYWMLYHLAPTR
jgi:uncharacterized membrane protein YozB (DUF420 family)